MNFKQDANSLPKLLIEKWLSLDMHAETISVILLRQHSLNDDGEKKKRRPRMHVSTVHIARYRNTGMLGRKHNKSGQQKIGQHGVKEVVQLERLTSELTAPTK